MEDPHISVSEIQLPPETENLESRKDQSIVLLPMIIKDDGTPILAQSTKTVAKLFRDNGLDVTIYAGQKPVLFREERGAEWLGPVLFISAAFYSSSPQAIA